MAIHVVQSHNINILLDAMIASSNAPSDNIFEVFKAQNFIVPNRSIEKWITQEVAKKNGVSGNSQFYTRINAFQWAAYQMVMDDKDFVRQANLPVIIVKWRIYEALKSFVTEPTFLMHPTHELFPIVERIYQSADHITDAQDALAQRQKMLYWVADQTSRLFVNYMSYRGQCNTHGYEACNCSSNWLGRWGQNKPLDVQKLMGVFKEVEDEDLELAQAKQLEAWQRWLWVNVFANDFKKIAEVDSQFWAQLENPVTKDQALARLPSELTVFTLLELPPQQLNFLRRLGQYIDVVIFHYNPSQEYWADSVDSRWKKQYDLGIKQRFIEQNQLKGKEVTDQEISKFFQDFTANFNSESRESRHPLLTRMGKQARDQFSLLASMSSGDEGQWYDLFEGDFKDNLLGQLQSDILHLLEPEPNSYPLQEDDQSIRVNACHSSLRQLEILKDDMLKWLADGTDQDPRSLDDILVLTPNIKNLEPLVRSVFSAVPKKGASSVYLPIKITGIAQSHVVRAWDSVLGRMMLTQGRFQYEEFADWLSLTATQICYGLDYPAVERILELLKEAGFKRSFDEEHASTHTKSADADYRFSFKFAVDRLMLGVAIDDRVVFEDVLSMPNLSSEDYELVGTLLEIYKDLDDRRHFAGKDSNSRTSEDWFKFLMQEVREYQELGVESLNNALDAIKSLERPLSLQANIDHRSNLGNGSLKGMSLPLRYIIDEVSDALDSKLDAAEPSGHITFAQMGHIRPIPYKLVVVLNMDSGVFPSHQSNIPFDLMRILPPSLGDRSRADDEHGAFLDSLLLAQDAFWIYFNGFDIDSGLPRQPSSLVQELIDHLALICTYGTEDGSMEYAKINELEVQKHLISLFRMHQLQPFDAKGFTAESQQFKNHWYEVARKIQSGEGEVQPWSNIVYTTPKTALQMNSSQWINHMVFPADLYLNAIDVRNVKAEDMMPEFEPLVLGGLEKYSVREQVYDHGADQSVVSDLLPVGKLKDVMWKHITGEHQQCVERLSTLVKEPVLEEVVTLNVADDLTLMINVPTAGTKHWAKIKASSAYGDHRTKMWLEYLLWMTYLNLGDQGMDHKLSVVFTNATIECSGLSSNEAKDALLKWHAAWVYGRSEPLTLPAKLIMSLAEKGKELSWEYSDKTQSWELDQIEDLVGTWTETFEFSDSFKFTDHKANKKHRDWAFILRNKNAVDELKSSCNKFSYDLYHLIGQHQKVVK